MQSADCIVPCGLLRWRAQAAGDSRVNAPAFNGSATVVRAIVFDLAAAQERFGLGEGVTRPAGKDAGGRRRSGLGGRAPRRWRSALHGPAQDSPCSGVTTPGSVADRVRPSPPMAPVWSWNEAPCAHSDERCQYACNLAFLYALRMQFITMNKEGASEQSPLFGHLEMYGKLPYNVCRGKLWLSLPEISKGTQGKLSALKHASILTRGAE
jgi:hypothetical protein